MGYSLAFSAIRCILQYIVLPFILPVLGIAAGWALGLTMIVNVAAIIAIVASVRRMWQISYSHRWRYMALAVPAFLLLVSFLVLDISVLVRG
jgi:ABC-type iron transport system FetAB permease component